jgi:hypothetical protein
MSGFLKRDQFYFLNVISSLQPMLFEQNNSAIRSWRKKPFSQVEKGLTKGNIIFPPNPPAPVGVRAGGSEGNMIQPQKSDS